MNWFGTAGRIPTNRPAFATAPPITGSRFPKRSPVRFQTHRLSGVHHTTALNRSTPTPQPALIPSPNSTYPPASPHDHPPSSLLQSQHDPIPIIKPLAISPNKSKASTPGSQATRSAIPRALADHPPQVRLAPAALPTTAARISERHTAQATTTRSTRPSPQHDGTLRKGRNRSPARPSWTSTATTWTRLTGCPESAWAPEPAPEVLTGVDPLGPPTRVHVGAGTGASATANSTPTRTGPRRGASRAAARRAAPARPARIDRGAETSGSPPQQRQPAAPAT